MKKVLVLLSVMIFGAFIYTANGQTGQQKKQMGLLDSEISKTEAQISSLEKKFEKEKKLNVFELKKKISRIKKNGNPRVSIDFDQTLNVKTEVNHLNAQIDSIESIAQSNEIAIKKGELAGFQLKRTEMIASWVKPENSIPREMRVLTKNRRQRSNVIRREELVLSKIESNINQEVDATPSEGGYKIIFDNQYGLNTTFILKGLDGGQRLSVNVAPKTKERHHVIPGNYLVEYYVGGRKLSTVTKLTVDGEIHYYETEPCYGFAYKSRY